MSINTQHYVGERLSLDYHVCTVRYIGPIESTTGHWLGVEWDDRDRGKHTGVYDGVRYFECKSKERNVASFIRPQRKTDLGYGFLDALKEKYVTGTASSPLDKPIYFNGKLAEEIGFDKIRAQFSTLQHLRNLLVESACLKGVDVAPLDPKQLCPELASRLEDIRIACANARQLVLKRNLLENFADIAAICSALPLLDMLDVSRNRFNDIRESLNATHRALGNCFSNVTELKLDFTLIEWQDLVYLLTFFPELERLSFVGNQLSKTVGSLPTGIQSVNLSNNDLRTLADVASLASSPSLQNISLQSCALADLHEEGMVTPIFPLVSVLDISETGLDKTTLWKLSLCFPSLKDLRCSNLSDTERLELIARIERLETLNSSDITAYMRTNAEIYYLNKTANEFQRSQINEEIFRLQHPRWSQLCSLHGDPFLTSRTVGTWSSARNLQNDLLLLQFTSQGREISKGSTTLDSSFKIQIPRNFSTHRLYMYVAERLDVLPRLLRITWVTTEIQDQVEEQKETVVKDSCNIQQQLGSPIDSAVLIPRSSRSISQWIALKRAVLRVEVCCITET